MFQLTLRKLDAISSTNNYLKDLISLNKLESGNGVWTLNQTKGYGQNGALWKGEPNKHLALSFYNKIDNLSLSLIYSINCASAMAVIDTLSIYQVPKLSVKWPNDILAGNKKICGILAENQINGQKIKSIIGIGINIYEKSFTNLPKATSVFLETNKSPLIKSFIEDLVKNINYYMSLCNNKSVNYLSKIFHKNLFSWKKKIKLNIKGIQVQAKIDKVEPNGLIKIEFEDGKMKHYQAKEIKIIY